MKPSTSALPFSSHSKPKKNTERQLIFSDAVHLEERLITTITPFWQRRHQGCFIGKDGLRIHWCALTDPKHTQAIVIVNGRVESTQKYQEVFWDLFNQGYDIYSYDHRGQGESDRLINLSDIGHVVNFDDYVDDLETFIEQVVDKQAYQKRTMLAHSMGGAIALLYLARHPQHVDALALSAPMIGINIHPGLRTIAQPLARALAYLEHPAGYVLNQGRYRPLAFEHNKLTQSDIRYDWFRQIYEQQPRLKVGGPSNQWLWQSLAIKPKLLHIATTLTTPILLLQAAEDKIVSNDAMIQFYRQRAKQGLAIEFDILPTARHELLFEIDAIRDKVLTRILQFFAR